MIFLWLGTGVSLVTALLAWRVARRTAHRLEELSQQYWALKYQQGELRIQLQRLQAAAGDTSETPSASAPAGPGERPMEGFVPLSSVRR